MRFDHLKRYGTRGKKDDVAFVQFAGGTNVTWKGKLWDLRSGESVGPAKGFSHTADGRSLQLGASGLGIAHVDGRVVPVEDGASLNASGIFVGPHVLFGTSNKATPWRVIDGATGKLRGPLEGQRKHPTFGMVHPTVFDPGDGRTLWLNEGTSLRCFDVERMAWTREVSTPPGTIPIGTFAVTDEGDVAVFLRPSELVNDRSRDVLVLLDADGREVARAGSLGSSMGVAKVGTHLVVAEDSAGQLRVFDAKLGDVETIAMMPGDTWAQLVALPSGREWLAIGGWGQWDHYGEPGLGPAGASRFTAAAPAKTAARGSAPKKKTAGKAKRG